MNATSKVLEEANAQWIVNRIDKEDHTFLAKDGGGWEAIPRLTPSGGILLFIEGAEFPQRCGPTPEALVSINIVKRICAEALRFATLYPLPVALLIRPRLFLFQGIESFNRLATKLLEPHYVSDSHLCPFAQALNVFLTAFLLDLDIPIKTAVGFSRNIAHLFEYDVAYRWRAQDIFTESSASALFSQRELKRLATLAHTRDDIGRKYDRVGTQTKRFLTLVRLAILLPSIKRALIKALSVVDYKELQFDEWDRYWCCFRTDYNFFGKSAKEREEMIQERGWRTPKSYALDSNI